MFAENPRTDTKTGTGINEFINKLREKLGEGSLKLLLGNPEPGAFVKHVVHGGWGCVKDTGEEQAVGWSCGFQNNPALKFQYLSLNRSSTSQNTHTH